MKAGDLVKVIKCDQCPLIVNKVVPVKRINYIDGNPVSVELNFGRGRPRKNRPKAVGMDDVSLWVPVI